MGALLQNTIFGRSKNSFVSTWRTSNISTGSTADTQIKLPLVASGTYNFTVDWGDGTSNVITIWNQVETTHTYVRTGDYTIRINGICTGWRFNSTGDRSKILSIQSWGKLKLGNLGWNFSGCDNLTLSNVSDILDLSSTTNLSNTFYQCTSLTTINNANQWNTSSITSLDSTFRGCNNFNQDISAWNTGNVTNMTYLFAGSIFDQNIGLWNVSKVTQFVGMFQSNSAFNNGGSPDINNWAINTSAIINMNQMFSAASSFNQPIGNWDVSMVNTMNSMFLSARTFNQLLNTWNTANVFSMNLMFGSTDFFNQNIGAWNVSKVTNFVSMFNNAKAFNNGGSPDINNWAINTSADVLMSAMFYGANNFNQNIGSWNVSKVTTFQGMFKNASLFNNGGNSSINNWTLNTTADINISEMFSGAFAFNQNIGGWNVSNVITFFQMFYFATSFNNGGSSDINNWLLRTNGTIVANMFQNATSFNQPIGNWNMIGVTSLVNMFINASAFNQNIGLWNVSNVTTINNAFQAAKSFNNGGSPDINNWVTTSLNTMTGLFNSASSFNQPIGNWNVSNVTLMNGVFNTAVNFNQDLSSWNTANVTNMNAMFSSALAFNQDIGNWNVSNVTNFELFMNGKTAVNFSTTNLDAIYNGWSSRPVISNISISFSKAKHSSISSAAKAILTSSPNNWIISDGGI